MLTGMANPMPLLPPIGRPTAVLISHKLAAKVDQGATRISRIYRRICLDVVLIASDAGAGPSCRADETLRYCLADFKRIAYRNHIIAHFELT